MLLDIEPILLRLLRATMNIIVLRLVTTVEPFTNRPAWPAFSPTGRGVEATSSSVGGDKTIYPVTTVVRFSGREKSYTL